MGGGQREEKRTVSGHANVFKADRDVGSGRRVSPVNRYWIGVTQDDETREQ